MSSLRSKQPSSGANEASASSQQSKDQKRKGKGKAQDSTKLKNKVKQNGKIWYKHKAKKKSASLLLRQPNEVLETIFKHVFIGVHMTDIKTTQRGTIQRTHGAQSVLFVCKELREVATSALFKYAVFDIPHFKLHHKHRRENKMKSLSKIQHLDLLWTPPPAVTFTTTSGDDAYILSEMKNLRSLQVWLLASQHLRLANLVQPELMSRVELHEAMLAKFEPSIKSQPRWLKRLLRDAPKELEGIDLSLVGFFAFGLRSGEDLTAAHISWPSKTIRSTDTIDWADWQRARAGLTCKRRLHRLFTYAAYLNNPTLSFDSFDARLDFARAVLRPVVGDRTFGRKVW